MVSRVEIFLGLTILFFVTQEIYTEIAPASQASTKNQKSLELSDATLHEVNQTNIQNIIMTDYMAVYPDYTQFKGLNLTTSTLTLIAQEAILKGDVIEFEQNTTVTKLDGTQYHAKSVRYDKQQRVLVLPNRFSIKSQRGDINGTALEYQSNQGILRGKAVDASYEME